MSLSASNITFAFSNYRIFTNGEKEQIFSLRSSSVTPAVLCPMGYHHTEGFSENLTIELSQEQKKNIETFEEKIKEKLNVEELKNCGVTIDKYWSSLKKHEGSDIMRLKFDKNCEFFLEDLNNKAGSKKDILPGSLLSLVVEVGHPWLFDIEGIKRIGLSYKITQCCIKSGESKPNRKKKISILEAIKNGNKNAKKMKMMDFKESAERI